MFLSWNISRIFHGYIKYSSRLPNVCLKGHQIYRLTLLLPGFLANDYQKSGTPIRPEWDGVFLFRPEWNELFITAGLELKFSIAARTK